MKRRTNLVHAAAIGGLCLAAIALYVAWYAYVGNATAEAVRLEAEIGAKTQETERARTAENVLSDLETSASRVEDYFVAREDIVPFLEELERSGRALGTGVNVASVTEMPATPHNRFVIAVQITGTFDNVVRTLGTIEYSPYDIVLQSLTLDTAPGLAAAGEWTAAVTLSVGNK